MRADTVVLTLATLALLCLARADPTWKKVTTIGGYQGRGETGLAPCGGNKLCLLGGRGFAPVNILDTETLTWATGERPPIELHHFQALRGPDACAWVVGAWTGPFPTEGSVRDIWRYCADGDGWSKVAPIARPRGAGGAFIYRGDVYLVSGTVGGHNPEAEVVAWFDKYNPTTKEWSRLPDVPHPRDHFHATVSKSRLILAGGRDSTGEVPAFFNDVETAVDVFDFDTKEWSSLPDFRRPRGGTMSAVIDDTVLVLGGEGEGRAWEEVDRLQGDTFRPFTEMPQPRHGGGATSCSGAIWIVGGALTQGGGSNAVDTLAYFAGERPPVCRPERQTPTFTPSVPVKTPGVPSPLDPLDDPEPSVSKPPRAPVGGGNSGGSTITPTPRASETPTETPESSRDSDDDDDDDDGSDSACFPSHAVVELRDGSLKTMANVQIGDVVKVAHPNEYSEIFFFSHRHESARTDTLRIDTDVDGISLSVSPGHLIYVNGRLAAASTVQVGDEITVSHESDRNARVVAILTVSTQGLYNPHTLHGDIVVDRVVASTFTSAVHPKLAKVLLSPFRALYHMVGPHEVVDSLNRGVLKTLDYTFWKSA